MKRILSVLVFLTLTGCTTANPVPTEPTGKTEPSEQAPPAPVRCRPDGMQSPQQWGIPEDRPTLPEGAFWVPDTPKQLPPTAYGILDHHGRLNLNVGFTAYELETSLPDAPPDLTVYWVGHYPDSQRERLPLVVAVPVHWEHHPAYSFVQYRGCASLGDAADVKTPDQAAALAAQALGPLLMADSAHPNVYPTKEGWVVVFHRKIGEQIVYVDKPLSVIIRGGQVAGAFGRRRPLISASAYPLRTAQEAWDLLKAGRGMPLYITESPTARHDFEEERFVAVRVELAYHEGHVDFASQAMQPYFIFWDAEGRVLGIPAVADAWATW